MYKECSKVNYGEGEVVREKFMKPSACSEKAYNFHTSFTSIVLCFRQYGTFLACLLSYLLQKSFWNKTNNRLLYEPRGSVIAWKLCHLFFLKVKWKKIESHKIFLTPSTTHTICTNKRLYFYATFIYRFFKSFSQFLQSV